MGNPSQPATQNGRAARPLQSRLLRGFASKLDPAARAALSAAIASGVACGRTNSAITADVLRRLS